MWEGMRQRKDGWRLKRARENPGEVITKSGIWMMSLSSARMEKKVHDLVKGESSSSV